MSSSKTKKICNLSAGAFQDLNDNPGKKFDFYLQYLSHEFDSLKSVKVKFMITKLSNGYFFGKFAVHPDKNDTFLEEVKAFDIIKTTVMLRNKDTSLCVIYDWEVIDSSVKQEVGFPIEYEKGAKNSKGDCKFLENDDKTSIPITQSEEFQRSFPYEQINASLIDLESIHVETGKEIYTPINTLNHSTKNVLIKGRAIFKSDVKSYEQKNGKKGFVFHIIIFDGHAEIQITFFDLFAMYLEKKIMSSRVYSIVIPDVQLKDRFNLTKSHFQVRIENHTVIKRLHDTKEIPFHNLKFTKISEIEMIEKGAVIDVIGIVGIQYSCEEIEFKDGKKKMKKKVYFWDDTEKSIYIEFWDKDAIIEQFKTEEIVIFQNVCVESYREKHLIFRSGSLIYRKIPDHQRFKELTLYLKTIGDNFFNRNFGRLNDSSKSNNPKKYFSNIQEIKKFQNEMLKSEKTKPMYFDVIATPLKIDRKCFFSTCRNDDCKKANYETTKDNKYRCVSCGKEFIFPKIRFFCKTIIADATDSLEIILNGEAQCFDFFNKSLEELKFLIDSSEEDFFKTLAETEYTEFLFKIKLTKASTLNDNPNVRVVCVSLECVDAQITKDFSNFAKTYIKIDQKLTDFFRLAKSDVKNDIRESE